ncbi:Glutaredoxin-like [Rhynchospora pubera]|uniref:Glutaredoxin-like n=1 Tax=Rhynchospora pubera TaxID=906938 RepID=A0AAV8FEN2_9POAL|nr:Glutaredoxin-like [Rhynchospora pubera]
MGCTGSKQAQAQARTKGKDKDVHGLKPKPYIRAQSLPITFLDYHPHPVPVPDPQLEILQSVTLTSSTLGSLDLHPKPASDDKDKAAATAVQSWSQMIDQHCKWAPLTPTKTPPNEPEVINVWELMAGLEDASSVPQPGIDRSFSFDDSRDAIAKGRSQSPIRRLHLDPDMIYAYLTKREIIPKFTGLVRERVNSFQERINARKAKPGPPAGEKRLVLYLTSLRGVRRTYEDCWDTKVILQTYGVVLDERDVAMHGGYKEELKEVLGQRFTGKLPQVFADGRHLGGAEEVKRMHEDGELGKVLGRCESVPVKKGKPEQEPCSGCGGMKFVPCETCSGSCKVFVSEDGEKECGGGGGFVRCKDCNENGLIRCPLCC